MPPGLVIVDDASDLRTILALAIRRDGRLRVLADAGDGRSGLAAVAEHEPDLVLMDISMPVMDGVTATRELKATRPDLLVVIFTGYGDERVAEEASRAGADAFVEKTTPLDELIEILVRLAGGEGDDAVSRTTPRS